MFQLRRMPLNFLALSITLSSLFSATTAGASSQQFDNINFELSGNRGEVTFDRAIIKENQYQITYRATTLDSSYTNGVMSFANNEMLASFKVDGKNIMNAISHFELKSGQVKKDTKGIVGSFSDMTVAIGDGHQEFKNLEIDCALSAANLSPLKSCLFNFNFKLEQITIDPSSFKTVQTLIPGSLTLIAKKKKSWIFEEVHASAGAQNFSLSFKLKLLLKLKFSVAGKLLDLPKTQEIGFTFTSAKLSLFSIKGLLLKAIELASIKNLRVEGDTLFLKL